MATNKPMTPLQVQGLAPLPKARVRVRTHLTSVQINDSQKANIDEAYKVFKATSGISASKGEFLEGLAQDFLKSAGGSSNITTGSLDEGEL